MKISCYFFMDHSCIVHAKILPLTSRYRCQASLLNNLSMHSYLVIQVTTTMAKSRWLDSQSRKNRGCLSLISNMKMQFSAIWAALKKLPKKVKLWIMSNIWARFFHVFMDWNIFFKAILASAQESCIRWSFRKVRKLLQTFPTEAFAF